VASLLRRGGFDLLHTHQAAADLAGAAASRLTGGVPLVSTRHDILPFRSRAGIRGSVFRLLDRDAVARSSWTVCVSEAVREFLLAREGADPGHLTVIHNGIDTGRFLPLPPAARRDAREALGLPGDGFVAGFIGRLEAAKGADLLPGVWDDVRRALPGAVLAVAGEGSLGAGLALRPGILPLGRVVERERFLPLLDLLVAPSRSEGFSLAVIEAASCGVPSVAFAAGGLAETVADGETGLLVPAGDTAAMADKVLLLAQDPPALRLLGGKARERAAARFGLDRMIDAYDALYRSLPRKAAAA
jgi:glycosyltransferase involved in cell wall biosynthesis